MNNLLELYNEISSLKELDIADIIEERLDLILRAYEETLDQSCNELANSNLMSVVKELSKNEEPL